MCTVHLNENKHHTLKKSTIILYHFFLYTRTVSHLKAKRTCCGLHLNISTTIFKNLIKFIAYGCNPRWSLVPNSRTLSVLDKCCILSKQNGQCFVRNEKKNNPNGWNLISIHQYCARLDSYIIDILYSDVRRASLQKYSTQICAFIFFAARARVSSAFMLISK